jgi:hypothetical protein
MGETMSLDVYLDAASPPMAPNGGSGIFIRRNGQTVEISREEWERHFPGQEPVVLTAEYGVDTRVYSSNITHNLGKMADAAGIYEHLWRPEEIGITHAKQLIEPLTNGLELLKSDPGKFEIHNPDNGWGNYEGLVAFVQSYLEACKQYPEASVSASR